jgi:hypothetical protein
MARDVKLCALLSEAYGTWQEPVCKYSIFVHSISRIRNPTSILVIIGSVVCLDPSKKNAGWHLRWVATASFEVISIPSPETGVLVASCNKPQNLLYTYSSAGTLDSLVRIPLSVWRYAWIRRVFWWPECHRSIPNTRNHTECRTSPRYFHTLN